jgi:hypothetical protein
MGAGVLLALLHGDEDNAVRAFGTIQGSGGSAFQDGEVLDILDVDVGETVGLHALLIPVALVVHVSVTDRNAVHDDERLVGTGNGGETADVDGDSAGGAARGRVTRTPAALPYRAEPRVGETVLLRLSAEMVLTA